MKMKKLMVIMMLMCSPAYAESVVTQGVWQHTPDSNYGDGAEAVVRAEQPIIAGFSGGLEYAYHGPTSHSGYGSFSGQSLLGEALYYPTLNWKIQPYLLGGCGWSWWSFDRSQDLIDKGIEVKLGNAFADKFAVGADYPINDHWSINLEWSYFHAFVPKKSFYSSDGRFANVVGGDTVGQEETNLAIGLRYSW
jgi:opacity protein-like surface antigen